MNTDTDSTDAFPSRYDRWKKPEFLYVGYTFSNADSAREKRLASILDRVRSHFFKEQGQETPDQTIYEWISRCKELIFDVADGKPVFHAIAYTFNVGRAEIEVGPLFDIPVSEDTPEAVSDSIRYILALAFFAEVPVVPNTDALAQELAKYHRDLMVEGFTAPDGTGNRVRLSVTKSPGPKIETIEFLRELSLSEPRYPAELALLREAVARELERLSTADRVLGALSVAIEQLSLLLTTAERNEGDLQRCLTDNPILFGLEYRRVIPKHKLGAEYEMDYALERVSGLVDIVEIEASTHRLFTGRGDPTKDLVHAEQQVLDWMDWLDRHHAYAREQLPGLMRPRGYVVIGRSGGLKDEGRRKLARRNTLFGESLQVLTYDDVLDRAVNMRNLLLGLNR